MKIDITRLVTDIKVVEQNIRDHNKHYNWPNTGLQCVATELYTLRAFLRNKNHRLNPPDYIRDCNASMRQTGRKEPYKSWSADKHNKRIAEKNMSKYSILEHEVQSEAIA